MNYSEKLKDPRWQKKRLEIFERDEFQCGDCGSKTKQLQLHHLYYVSGREPWEYPAWAFLTLCADCHSDRRNYDGGQSDWELLISELGCDPFCADLAFEICNVKASGYDLDKLKEEILHFVSEIAGVEATRK